MTPRLDARKRKIKAHLEDYITEQCPKRKVAVLLSGGADSTVVALAAHHMGKQITAFSFMVNGFPNEDFEQAKKTSAIMGWNFVPVKISRASLHKRFIDLFSVYGCSKKTEAECLFPMLDVIDAVRKHGFRQVLTGFGSFIPTNRNASILCARDPKEYWASRRERAGIGDSSATEKIIEVAQKSGLIIQMPLCHEAMVKALGGLTTKEMMGRPYQKHHYKDIYYADFLEIGLIKARSGSLQVNGQIEELFASLVCDKRLPIEDLKGNQKQKLVALCRRLGSEVKQKAHVFSKDIKPKKQNVPYKPYSMSAVKRNSKKALFTVVSTFAGGGGSSTGYRLAGGRIIFANEFVDAAVKTYQLNFPDTPVVSDDIRKLNRNKDTVLQLFKRFGINKRELDIFDGSPPCATFSLSNAGRGKDKMAKKNVPYSDTVQSRIGYLIHDYVFMANVMQPKVCIMENVPGIVKSHVFEDAMGRLKRYGYIVAFKKLVASDYGVPQKRERLFTLAIRPDIAKKAGIKSSDDFLAIFPEPYSSTISTRDALSGINVDPVERDMLLTKARKDSLYEIMKVLPFDPEKHTRISDIKRDWKTDFNLTRMSWDLPAPTITATGAQGRGGLCHPSENRLLTINELKRLMGIPDDFQLFGTFNQKAERIGRMVCPNVTKEIAQSVYSKILSRAA
jgi:DNA-cytosine methyltransferase